MKKNIILILIIVGITAGVLALIYTQKITVDKNKKNSNIESLQHSWAWDIE